MASLFPLVYKSDLKEIIYFLYLFERISVYAETSPSILLLFDNFQGKSSVVFSNILSWLWQMFSTIWRFLIFYTASFSGL